MRWPRCAANPVARSVVVYGVAFAASGATPFILLPILTKTLSPLEFGKATSFLILALMVANVAGLSSHGFAAVRYFKSTRAEFKDVVSTAIFAASVAHLVVLPIVPLMVPQLARWFQLSVGQVSLAVAAACLVSLNQLFLAIYQSSGKPLLYLAARLIQASIEILLCIALLFLVVNDANSRIISYVAAVGISACVGFRYCWNAGHFRLTVNRRDATALMKFAVPLIPHIMAGTAVTYIDRVIVSSLLGVAHLGVYMVGMQVGMAMSVLIEPMNKALAPWLFEQLAKNDAGVNRMVVRNTYLFYAGLIAVGLIVTVLGRALFDHVIGPEYAGAKRLIPWMVAGFVFQGMYYSVVNYIFYAEKTGRLSAVSCTTALLGVCLSYALISQYGMAGAGISFALTNLVLFVMTWIAASRMVSMPWLLR